MSEFEKDQARWREGRKEDFDADGNYKPKKEICPLCDEPFDSETHELTCQLYGG